MQIAHVREALLAIFHKILVTLQGAHPLVVLYSPINPVFFSITQTHIDAIPPNKVDLRQHISYRHSTPQRNKSLMLRSYSYRL